MLKKPWLSLIVPTYNGEAFLARALGSVAEQQVSGLECIVVDDGSTDATRQIIQDFARHIPIVFADIERTGNWVANTNTALNLARGDYACFLHQDDFWLAKRLSVIRKLVRQYPAADLFLSPAIFVDRQGKTVGHWHCPLPEQPGPVESEWLRRRLLIQNFIAIPSPVFKREVARAVGGLDESLWYTADWDFWLKLAAGPTIYSPEPLAAFRLHPHSQTVTRSFDIAGFQQQMETVLHRHAPRLQAQGARLAAIKRVALFSIQVNTALAARIHGAKVKPGPLLASFIALGPLGWRQYLRDSRIIDRIAARVRAAIV